MKQHMLYVQGEPFRCSCGCNVFHINADSYYQCNACAAEYEGTPCEEENGDE